MHTVYWWLSEINHICYYLDFLNIFLSHLLYKKEGDEKKRLRERESFKDTITQNLIGEVWDGGGGRVLRGKVNFLFAGMMWW